MSSITVYQTDADSAYIHEAQAQELALDPGVFNVPYGALLTPPPNTSEGQVAVAISGDNWVVMADHRGETLYRTDNDEEYALGTVINIDGKAARYSGLGEVPNWLTEVKPIPIAEIDDATDEDDTENT